MTAVIERTPNETSQPWAVVDRIPDGEGGTPASGGTASGAPTTRSRHGTSVALRKHSAEAEGAEVPTPRIARIARTERNVRTTCPTSPVRTGTPHHLHSRAAERPNRRERAGLHDPTGAGHLGRH